MNAHDRASALRAAGASGWIDAIAARMIHHAARNAPDALSERLEEEWLAGMSEQRGRLSRVQFALGCCWAAMVISRDDFTEKVPVTCSEIGNQIMTAPAYPRTSLFSRSKTPAAGGSLMYEINTTPLVDVMLVLLITLIYSVPIMTHAVVLDLPQTPPPREPIRPEVIELDIDFDGTVLWNGTAVANLPQLESYLHAEAQRDPQPEIHVRADRRVKYDFVAKVLASAQHNRMKKIGIVDMGQFAD
jgi:biopolymer transport protein ExbD